MGKLINKSGDISKKKSLLISVTPRGTKLKISFLTSNKAISQRKYGNKSQIIKIIHA